MTCSPILLRRLTPTLWAWTDPAIVTHGTPIYRDSQVVVVPAYGNVSKLQEGITEQILASQLFKFQ